MILKNHLGYRNLRHKLRQKIAFSLFRFASPKAKTISSLTKELFSCQREDKRTSLTTMNRIKEVLEEKGIKQTWLADKLRKSYNMVNDYVQNRQQPRLEVLFEIAEIFGVKPTDFIKDK